MQPQLRAMAAAVSFLLTVAIGGGTWALRDGLRAEGLGVLRWSRDSNQLRQRMWFCRGHLGAPWPAVNDEALLAQLSELDRVVKARPYLEDLR